jgi:pheromone shutdown-related protein TraB
VPTLLEMEPMQNVEVIELEGRTIHLVGTAHVSRSSVDLATQVIAEVQPESVCVELCESRFRSLTCPERWRSTNIIDVIRQGRTYTLFAQIMLASFQRRLGKKLSIEPGAEMKAAIEAARGVNAELVLADRDISITLKRTWSAFGFFTLMKLIYAIVRGMFDRKELNEIEIERMKGSDALEEVMREFTSLFPSIRKTLIDERDIYLANKISAAPGKSIVAIVGAAHVPGILRMLGQSTDLRDLEAVPAKRLSTKLAGWSIPAIVIGSVAYSFIFAGSGTVSDMMLAWFWITGFCGALGAAVVCAHPITVITAFIAAPFASLNPFIAAGWIAGIAEALIRKPRVGDLEQIADDVSSLRGIFSNHVTRTLLIVASVNIFVMIGMMLGAKEVITHLS